MMKKRESILLVILMLSSLITTPQAWAREDYEQTDILEDAYITLSAGPTYTASAGTSYLLDSSRRAYVEFNLTEIPDTAIIDRVTLSYYGGMSAPGQTGNISFREVPIQPSTLPDNNQTNSDIYWNITGFTIYNKVYYNNETQRARTIELVGAGTDLDLVNDYFTLGMNASVSGGYSYIQTSTGANPPVLIVHYYHSGDYQIPFDGAYYENGTGTTDIEVTATLVASQETFTAGNTTEYYPTLPVAWLWDIGGGYSRIIYAVGNESLMVTYPDGDDYTYSFTVKDLTGNVGTDSFLEAYRIINGSETLISRMPIEQPNAVPMNLVFGRTYRMKIRFGDGSTYDWGYLIPGSDTTITLLLRVVEFSDGAQILYNHITVDAVRTTGLITVDYLDDRNNTIWANVSIRIRNGAVVQTYSRNNESYTINYAGFNDSLGYIVTVTGQHSDFGVWGRTFILDQSFTFPDAPDFSGIFGDAISNFIPFLLVCVTILIFPVSMQPIGLLGGGVMASMLSFFGWADWTFNLLAFYWFIAIIVNLTVSGRGT